MGRVVLVSNRVVDPAQAAQAGGVAVAIADYLSRGDALWLGWSGQISAENDLSITVGGAGDGVELATISLTEAEYEGFYLGYANSVLWPVFHNRLDLAEFEAGYFDQYKTVNRKFAMALAPLLRADDIIWVHDYHFISLAQELRALGISNRIGFFLHIPFPPGQSFLAVPEHRLLAHAFSEYDLIGLQTATDVAHMIDYLEHGVHGQMLPDGRLRVGDRVFRLGSFPIGMDTKAFDKHPPASKAASDSPVTALQERKIRIIGVDRLDYTKGLPQKFRAFGRFLERNPSYRNIVVLTQIAAPTRESVEAYTDIRKELESLSGEINGKYGDLEWVPIHYINRTASRARLASVYRESAIGLVTPLRDGMNLVAKEYVAAQDPARPGVLILSQFAGAAEQLSEALIVNPYNIDEIADAIRIAVEMPLSERCARHAALMAKIVKSDATAWADRFLASLRHDDQPGQLSSMPSGRLRRAMHDLSHPLKNAARLKTSPSLSGQHGPPA